MKNLASYNLQHLYCFHVVAEEGSIKSAAHILRVTQPAISSRIRVLENEINSPLFHRKHRSLVLTSTGQGLYEYTQQIFALAERALSGLVPLEKPKMRFRIGVVESVSTSLIYELIRPYWQKNTILQVSRGTYSDLQTQLARDQQDLIIVDTEPNYRRGWTIKEIEQRRLIFVGAPQFKHLKNNFPRSLDKAPLLSFSEDNALSLQLDRFLTTHKVRPDIVGEVDDHSLLLSFLLKGIAVGVMSYKDAEYFLDSKQLLSLGEMKSYISRLWVIRRN